LPKIGLGLVMLLVLVAVLGCVGGGVTLECAIAHRVCGLKMPRGVMARTCPVCNGAGLGVQPKCLVRLVPGAGMVVALRVDGLPRPLVLMM
jgi:hypothetical protein